MAVKDITIRIPTPSDAAAIACIDAEGLATGHATFRNTPHDWDSFSASFLTERGLALVAEDDNLLAAWAGVSPTSARAVYKGVGGLDLCVSEYARTWPRAAPVERLDPRFRARRILDIGFPDLSRK